MGQVYQPRIQALDVNGNPISGAKLYLYDSVATTTPKASYTNNALTVAHASPIVADSSGVFPQIYATSGEAYYAVLKTSAGVLVDDFDFVTSLGADDASTLLKDFGVGGRFQVRGSAGTVYIEVGDALGDDIGGTGRLGGWAGTQGTLLTVDMATVALTGNLTVAGTAAITGAATVGGNLTVTGTLTASGLTNFVQKLSSGTITAAASQVIALPSGYDKHMLVLANFSNSAAAVVSLVFSFDAGATYKTAAGDYDGETSYGGTTISQLSASTEVPINGLEISRYGAYNIDIYSNASTETIVSGQGNALVTAGGAGRFYLIAGATNAKSYGKASHVKLQCASGTITCKYALFGVPSL